MERIKLLAVPKNRSTVKTFGEKVTRYSNHGIRDSLPSAPIGLNSIPNPPSFIHRQLMSHKSKIKSSEEIQLEECKKQFRARANPPMTQHRQSQQLTVPRKLTTHHPSHRCTNFPSRKQRGANLQMPDQRTHPKKMADMEWIKRLAVPISRPTVKTFGEEVTRYLNRGIRGSLPSTASFLGG